MERIPKTDTTFTKEKRDEGTKQKTEQRSKMKSTRPSSNSNWPLVDIIVNKTQKCQFYFLFCERATF